MNAYLGELSVLSNDQIEMMSFFLWSAHNGTPVDMNVAKNKCQGKLPRMGLGREWRLFVWSVCSGWASFRSCGSKCSNRDALVPKN